MNHSSDSPPLKNRFDFSEWAGAVGDLGTTLPLAFALVVFNHFPTERIFFLWGLMYILWGWYYKVPVAIQPLKAMAVIAIAGGFATELLSTTAFFYGVLFLLLSISGVIRKIERWFSPALVRGIQLGIGLILGWKAVELVVKNGYYLSGNNTNLIASLVFVAAIMAVLWAFQFRRNVPAVLVLILGGLMASFLGGVTIEVPPHQNSPMAFTVPEWEFFTNALILLIIPQLPLTLGNAVFAASDACHTFWKEQARRVSPTRLGTSIGISNVIIGLLGGFPVCHGAGGIGAHAQFGGKTGGTTIIIGSVLVVLSLVPPLSDFLFFIPVPILSAMLLWDSWRMMSLIRKLGQRPELVVAGVVGVLSFLTRNLAIALIIGFVLEYGFRVYQRRTAQNREAVESSPSDKEIPREIPGRSKP
ncbi:MAG: hypothetical protein D6681_03080 [Calditrichaeota bacterium]|nr:MAG: hypothetical protein D6681_03080 [Calditrichota bacterium]